MTSRTRIPTLALAILSIGLNLAILGCAARALAVYNSSKTSSPFFLPVWSQHFDTRELSALIGTSTVIFLLNLLLVLGAFVPSLSAPTVSLSSTALSTLLALLALVLTSVLNSSPTHRETLQTWTCRWRSASNANPPRDYDTLCNETSFAFYTTIPSFIAQLLLLSMALHGTFVSRSATGSIGRGRMRLDEEKAGGAHEMGSVRQQASFDTRLGTPKSMNDSVRYLGSGPGKA